jgi:hypothetical protein
VIVHNSAPCDQHWPLERGRPSGRARWGGDTSSQSFARGDLAKALDITRFEVYESYLDEDYTNNKAKRLMIKTRHRCNRRCGSGRRRLARWLEVGMAVYRPPLSVLATIYG